MKKVFILFFLVVVLAVSAYGFLRLKLGESLHNRAALETLFFEQLDRVLAEHSKGENRLLQILGEKLGRCSYARQSDPFPFSKPVLLTSDFLRSGASTSRKLTVVTCKIPPDNTPILFTSNMEGAVRFLRLPGRPVILEVNAGVTSVAADKLHLQIKLPHAYLDLRSTEPVGFDFWKAHDGTYGLEVKQGHLLLDQELISDYRGTVPVVTMRAVNTAALSVSGERLANEGNFVTLLPSGLNRGEPQQSP